jgi:hypothetical protein
MSALALTPRLAREGDSGGFRWPRRRRPVPATPAPPDSGYEEAARAMDERLTRVERDPPAAAPPPPPNPEHERTVRELDERLLRVERRITALELELELHRRTPPHAEDD